MGRMVMNTPPTIALVKSNSGLIAILIAIPRTIIPQRNALIKSKMTPDQNHSFLPRSLGFFKPFFPHFGQKQLLNKSPRIPFKSCQERRAIYYANAGHSSDFWFGNTSKTHRIWLSLPHIFRTRKITASHNLDKADLF